METSTKTGSTELASKSTKPDDTTRPLPKDLKDTVRDVVEPLKEKALEAVDERRDAGADQIKVVARAIRGAAKELESEMPQLASYIRRTGAQLDEASIDLRERKLDELLESFDAYAKRRPAMVLGGAVLAGVALSRFLKSSEADPKQASPRAKPFAGS